MKNLRIGVFCGERWWSLKSWIRYWGYKPTEGFSIGPILFWDRRDDV